jgi:DNA-binding CsgD family transcriptional regulator
VGADVTGDLSRLSQLLVDARRAHPDLGESIQTAVAASYLLLNGDGDVDTAHRLLVGAIETQADRYSPDDPMLVEAVHNLLEVCLYGGRPELWESFPAAIGRLNLASDSVLRLWVNTVADPVRTAAAELGRLEAAIAGLREETDPTRIERVATATIYVDRMVDAREPLWRVVHSGRAGGPVTSAINALMLLCIDDFKTGRWDEAQQAADEGIQLCDAHGYHLLSWPLRLSQALIAAARGNEETSRALTDEMTRWAAPRGVGGVLYYAAHARSLTALGQGDFDEAYRQAASISPPGTFVPYNGYALWTAMDLVEAAVRANRPAEAAAHVAAMREADIAALSSRLALLANGSAAMAAARGDDWTHLFERALATPDADRWPFDLARVQLAYGERLRRSRAPTESRLNLSAALSTFQSLGAEPWVLRATNELRATGASRPKGTGSDGAALTPQEREIATLAAAGLTNKQIADRLLLSHRTVGAHLYRVFPKLGVRSRAALRDALASLPPPSSDGRAENWSSPRRDHRA